MPAGPQHTPGYRRLTALLRRVREEAALSQREMSRRLRGARAPAVRVSLDPSMVHRTETGDRRIDPMEFIGWCQACGCDPAETLRELYK